MRRCLQHPELQGPAFPDPIGERGGRSAFTLLELLLVLAVMVTVVSLTWPSVLRYLRDQEILEGAEAARSAAASTRIKAIDTGLTYQFRYEPEGRRFVVIPFDPPETIAASSTATEDGQSTYPVLAGQLGEASRFVIPDDQPAIAEGLPRESFANLPNANDLEATTWGPPILFFPDGSAEDSRFFIVNEDELRVDLTLRGLTGTVSIGPLRQEAGP